MAALLTEPERFRGYSVSCVISGGNVDKEIYRQLLATVGQVSVDPASNQENAPWTD
ncbi:hypothetical protein ACWJKU_08980 [Methylocaldum sp. MU1018]